MSIIVLIIIATLLLPGCFAVGPDYVKKNPQTLKRWHTRLDHGLVTGDNREVLAHWWNTLRDKELVRLEARALRGNLDIKEAIARIKEARAQRNMKISGLFPSIDLTGRAKKQKTSKNSGSGRITKLYASNFDSAWELDIFGGIRRSVEAAQADLDAAHEELNNVLVTLLAEVARNYIEVRIYQNRLSVLEKRVKVLEELFELTEQKNRAGILDSLSMEQALYELERTRSSIPPIEISLEEAKNRIAVLLGELPGSVQRELERPMPIPSPPDKILVGVPADTITQRPDVREAERKLAAETARIGVAISDLYPKIRINGSIGIESISTGNFFTYNSRTWGFGPSLTWNIFDAGKIRNNIRMQKAIKTRAFIEYKETVLKAHEEIENRIMSYVKEINRKISLERAVDAARRASNLAIDQYRAGLSGFDNVLETNRTLLTLQDELVNSRGSVMLNLVSLYKAFGGGWQSANRR